MTYMKRFFSLLVAALAAVQFALAGDVITQDVNQLPEKARTFIGQYFAQSKISHIKIDSELLQGKKYEVLMTDRTELEFDSKGNWSEVDCKKNAVPATLVPVYVKEYIKVNFPGQTITKIERHSNGVIEVEMANDFSLKFNKKGKFIGADD